MADTITIDLNPKPAIDGFEQLIDETLAAEKAMNDFEDAGENAIGSIGRIRPAVQTANPALNQMQERLSQLGVQFSTGSEKVAGFVPQILRLGPAGATAVAAVGSIAGALAILNNTGLRDGQTNLTRLGETFGRLGQAVNPGIDVLGTADRVITGMSDTIIFNTDALAKNLIGWRNWVTGLNSTPGAEKFLGRQQKATESNRQEEEKLKNATLDRAKAAELAGVKSVNEINQRRNAIIQERTQINLASMDEAEREKRLEANSQRRAALENRLLEIEKEAGAARAAAARYWADQRIAAEVRITAAFEAQRQAESKAYQASIEFQKQVARDWQDFQRGLASDRRDASISDVEAIVRARNEQAKALAERLTGAAKEAAIKRADDELDGELHSLRVKRIQAETNDRLSATKVVEAEENLRRHRQTEGDAKLNSETMRAYKNREAELQQLLKDAQQEGARIILEQNRKLATEEADFKRSQLVRQINDRTSAIRKQIELEKKKKEEMDKLGEEDSSKFDADKILKSQRRDDVKRNVLDQARAEAERKYREKNVGLGREAESDEGAARRFQAGQSKAGAAAVREASAQWAKGKTDPAQIAQAEVAAANKTVAALVGNGKLNASVAQALSNQFNIASKQEAKQNQMDRELEALMKAQGMLLRAANPVRNRSSGQTR